MTETLRSYLLDLQSRIAAAIEQADGRGRFLREPWQKTPGEALQGDGITQIMEGGAVFERAGSGCAHVPGGGLPPSATQRRPE